MKEAVFCCSLFHPNQKITYNGKGSRSYGKDCLRFKAANCQWGNIINCQNYLLCFRNHSEHSIQKRITLDFENQIYYLSETKQEFSNSLDHCLPTPFFNMNLATPPLLFVYLMIHKLRHMENWKEWDHPCSFCGYACCSEQPSLGWEVVACVLSPLGTSCREAVSTCDCTGRPCGKKQREESSWRPHGYRFKCCLPCPHNLSLFIAIPILHFKTSVRKSIKSMSSLLITFSTVYFFPATYGIQSLLQSVISLTKVLQRFWKGYSLS